MNHGFARSPSGAITTFDAPGEGTGAGQGALPETPNMFGVITGQYNVHFGFLRNPYPALGIFQQPSESTVQ